MFEAEDGDEGTVVDAGEGSAAGEGGGEEVAAEDPPSLLDPEAAGAIEGVDPLKGMSAADVLKDAPPPVKALVAGLNRTFTQKLQEVAAMRDSIAAERAEMAAMRAQFEELMYGSVAEPGAEPDYNPMDPESMKAWQRWNAESTRHAATKGVRERMAQEAAQNTANTALFNRLTTEIPELLDDSSPVHGALEAELAKMPPNLGFEARQYYVEAAVYRAQRATQGAAQQGAAAKAAAEEAARRKAGTRAAMTQTSAGTVKPVGKPVMPKGLSLGDRVRWLQANDPS